MEIVEAQERANSSEENVLESIPDSIDLLADGLNFITEPCIGESQQIGLDLFTEPCIEESPQESSNPSPIVVSSWIDDLEQFLLQDNNDIVENSDFRYGFFSDLLLDAPSDERTLEDAPANVEISDGEAKLVEDNEEKEKSDVSEEKAGKEDELLSKKRKRQMRNRDSAMKSRERKKLYVRDLEAKSRYLEGECKRLEYALRCCIAENQVLYQCLHKEKGLGVSGTKQESAVLIKESLLLGSLFWLMSIVCLFLLRHTESMVRIGNVGRRRRSNSQEVVTVEVKQTGNEDSLRLRLGMVYLRRRCRAMRTKMKRVVCCLRLVLG